LRFTGDRIIQLDGFEIVVVKGVKSLPWADTWKFETARGWSDYQDGYQGIDDLKERWNALDDDGSIDRVFELAKAQKSKEAPLIVQLAEKLWGAASSKYGRQIYFKNDEVVVELDKGVWFDSENNKGGYLNDLMKLVTARKNEFGPVKDQLLQSSAEFVKNYVPPDYLIDGWLQRRYVYSFTAPTGSGKTAVALRIAIHVALGLPLAGRDIEKGFVLFFAGENPDDVRSRWIMLCEEMGYDPKNVDVFFMPFTLDLEEWRKKIDEEAEKHGPFSLLIVDTSASYYSGDEENDNVQLGNHARMLRTFVGLPGGPTVLVTCHPTKTPNMESLLPRGGGAFLAEVDGNIVGIKEDMVIEITWHGKFRGPDFPPFSFKLVPGKSDKLVDTKGRHIWSITAKPISNAEQELIVEAAKRNQDVLLRAMLDFPGSSIVQWAEKLQWTTTNNQPNKNMVGVLLKELKKAKLVELNRRQYVLTAKGKKEAENLPASHYAVATPIDGEGRVKF
jgi:predicted nuclease of predicted toxin-antitoxin system